VHLDYGRSKLMPNDSDDYDDGSEESGRSRDWNMEPGDPGWLGDPEPTED